MEASEPRTEDYDIGGLIGPYLRGGKQQGGSATGFGVADGSFRGAIKCGDIATDILRGMAS